MHSSPSIEAQSSLTHAIRSESYGPFQAWDDLNIESYSQLLFRKCVIFIPPYSQIHKRILNRKLNDKNSQNHQKGRNVPLPLPKPVRPALPSPPPLQLQGPPLLFLPTRPGPARHALRRLWHDAASLPLECLAKGVQVLGGGALGHLRRYVGRENQALI